MPPDLRLKVDGMLYGGWQSVRIRRSIEQLAGTFELAVTDRWSGQSTPRPIRPGAECEILIDGAPVITGYVDDVGIDYDDGNHSINVTGRDKTGDLVDCTADYFSWLDITLKSAAERMCKPFGVNVVDELNASGNFSSYRHNPGDSVFAALDGAAKVRGAMLVSDGLGGLVITRASKERIPTALELGENIKACSATFSHKDRFSEYTVTSQQEVKDGDTYAETAFHIEAKSLDPVIARYRPIKIMADKLIDRKQTQERADWERNVRYGKGQRVQYSVAGWYYEGQKVWPINRMVPVKDDFLGIAEDLLIVSVELSLDESVYNTSLVLTPREAFDLVPIPEDGDKWPVI